MTDSRNITNEDETVAVLKRVKALIRKGWTQGPTAVSKKGRPVDVDSRAACKWCLYGALMRAESDLGCPEHHAWKTLWDAVGGPPISFNEEPGRTKKQVIAKIDEAISALDQLTEKQP